MSEAIYRHIASQLFPAERHTPEPPARGQAAVLIALIDKPEGPDVLLTLRARHLKNHPGEVAFPGGKWEREDHNLVRTALRESFEETGLPSDKVRLLGRLANYQTQKGVVVTPVVGVIPPGLALTPDPSELDDIFSLPLAELAAGRAQRWDEFERAGKRYRVPVYQWQQRTIWGLTAAMACKLAKLAAL